MSRRLPRACEAPKAGRSEGIDVAETTHSETTSETRADAAPITMVVTLKSGAQIRADVDEYRIQHNRLGGLVGIKWQAVARPTAAIEYLDVSEVAAVHTEWSNA